MRMLCRPERTGAQARGLKALSCVRILVCRERPTPERRMILARHIYTQGIGDDGDKETD